MRKNLVYAATEHDIAAERQSDHGEASIAL
jgi:hypothetical protein